MSKTALLLTVGLLTALLTGCGTTGKFIYPDDGRKLVCLSKTPKYQKKIAVTPFDEMRGNNNQSGTFFLFLVPLMPFGWVDYERPEAATIFLSVNRFDFNPSEDLAKAAAYSLRKSGLFTDAFFTFGGEKDKADLLLEGEIVSTEYIGSIWSYGLSAYHALLKIFGAPHGTSENHLILKLKVTKMGTNEKVWEKNYSLKKKIIQGFYYKLGHDVKSYSFLMQEVMNDAIKGINEDLDKRGIK